MEAGSSATANSSHRLIAVIFLCFGILRFTLLTYGLVQKRAESSSFAEGRIEPTKASTVTKMTLDYPVVTFRAIILFVANLPEIVGLEPQLPS
ncbi:hypothetical protein CFII64_01676 [Pseudomonas sp. CFII64]|nr:hypothetical protein CFII64_01676 [Pseudomonas sp. CFII64]